VGTLADLAGELHAAQRLGQEGSPGEWLAASTIEAVPGVSPRTTGLCLAPPIAGESRSLRWPLASVPPEATGVLVLAGGSLSRLVWLSLDDPAVTCAPVRHLADEPRFDVTAVGARLDRRDTVLTGPPLRELLTHDVVRRCGYLLGLATSALDLATDRAKRRRQFGAAIGTNQAVAFPLASGAARLAAARALASGVAGAQGPPVSVVAGLWRHVVTVVRDVTATVVHLHGTHGLTAASPVQRLYRQALLHTTCGTALSEGEDT
jgi:hypothetical protein